MPEEIDTLGLYLRDISRHPLLNADDEVALAKVMEAGREAAAELDRAPGLATERRRQLGCIATDGERARRRFTEANLRLVVSFAKGLQGRGLDMLDLIQEGNLGLMHAVDRFDWRKGFKFSTYASWWIRQAIRRGIANTSSTIRLPVHAHATARKVKACRMHLENDLGRVPTPGEVAERAGLDVETAALALRDGSQPVSLNSPAGADSDTELVDFIADPTATPVEELGDPGLGDGVAAALDQLDSDRDRAVLTLRHGLDGYEPLTLAQAGDHLGLSAERVRQLEAKAIVRLRQSPAAAGLSEYA